MERSKKAGQDNKADPYVWSASTICNKFTWQWRRSKACF